MRALRPSLLIAVLALSSLAAAPGASAATVVGDDCVADSITGEATLVELANGSGRQVAVPANGIITRWQVQGIPEFGGIPQWMKILRPTGAANFFRAIDEEVGVIDGTSSYPTRIPVQAGDRIGLASDEATFICKSQAGSETGFFEGNLPVGAETIFNAAPGTGVPVMATVEPDADNDGYGDETQDLCPRSAELLVACPALGIDAYAVQTRGFVKIFAAPFGPGKASIAFNAKVKIPAADSPTRKSLDVTWKGTRSGTQGQFTTAKLKFSRHLIESLKRPGVALPLKIKVTATNVAGLQSTRKLTLKVR
ncbi:MAG TPA: hypothetical protein VIT85_08630 [Solirubrobacterales bacterium]